jgi:hypothetical protein
LRKPKPDIIVKELPMSNTGIKLARKKIKAKGVVKLGGIWGGMGFEKIDLKKELKLLRNDLSKAILKQAL